MSHSQVLSRLTGADRSDMIKRFLRRVIDKTGLLAAAVLFVGTALAAPAVARASVHPAAVSPYTFTPRRIGASLTVVVALIGALIGGRALARAGNGRRGAIV